MKKLAIIVAAFGILSACEKADDLSTALPGQNTIDPGTAGLRTARPFSATLSAAVDVNSTNPPTACSGDIPFAAPDFLVSGIATHTGQLDAQLSLLHHVSCNVSLETMQLTTSVTVELVSANGDKINLAGEDVVDIAALIGGTGLTGAITGAWTITGGTGRFSEATGTLEIAGVVDFATNTFTCSCAGTLNY